MSLKKKLGMGVASAALGLSLIGGGTYAYFSDTEITNNTFAAGTLDLVANPTTIIDVDNIKPGDTMLRSFELQNNGTLDIKNVVLNTAYEVNDANGNNAGADFGEHIRVNFLFNIDKLDVPVWSTTLADLRSMDPKAVKNQFETLFGDQWGTRGLAAGSSDLLYVQFEFVDNGEDQNVFQGDSLSLEWKFTASQKAGSEI
ncbi:CalY family protein [Bacillus sp. T33-2]|uniref:CalY family protein n=1 Tax=Bacillus sp. T33-2 TaxID=2054168 RepID=UPI000C77C65E|nr:CalY family protein [Bacillus sp. T33-2]PLR99286.1 cell division protein FtsN [Bacillus sp. T33-2]